MKKVIIGLVLLMSTFIIGSIFIYQQSNAPYASAEEETIQFVNERTDLVQTEEFYWYNGNETYFTVVGLTDAEEEMIYIVQQDGGQITTLSAEDTLSREQAIQLTREAKSPEDILNARIGMMDETPIWEITYQNENDRLGYYIIDLQTGEWIRTIDNI